MSFYEWFFLEKDRPAAGLFSWSHLLSVTIILAGFITLGYFLGKKHKDNQKAQRLTFIMLSICSINKIICAFWYFYFGDNEDVIPFSDIR